jgi:hypothetical protein
VAVLIILGEKLGCRWVPESNFVPLKGEHNILQPIIANTLFDNIQRGLASDSDCGCDSDNLDERGLGSLRLWHFPILCTLLYPMAIFLWIMWGFTLGQIFFDLAHYIYKLGEVLGCRWVPEINSVRLRL